MTPEHLDYRSRSPAAQARDAALARVGRARRWVIVGAAALTAGFAALVSAVAPGRSLASKAHGSAHTARSGSSSSGSAIPPLPALANAGQLGLQAPGQAPSTPDQSQSQSIPSQPPPAAAPPSSGGGGGVVSGGS